MSELKIITNNVPRNLLYWHELTDKERAEFDYLDTEDKQMEGRFFRYRGNTYDMGEFVRVEPNSPFPKKWEGHASDSYFSGVLVRYVQDGEGVVCALYLS